MHEKFWKTYNFKFQYIIEHETWGIYELVYSKTPGRTGNVTIYETIFTYYNHLKQ